MTFYFVEKPEIIRAWLQNKGYSGTIYDALHAYLQTKSSMDSAKIYDLLNDKLTSMGFSGTIGHKLRTFFRQKMNESDWKKAERRFWRDFTTDFEVTEPAFKAIVDEDGDFIVDEDGNQIFG